MNDYSELKRLAEACGNLNWRFLTEKLTEYGIRDDHGYIAFLPVGHPAKYGACPEQEAKARFLGAMTPTAVRALISELDQLKAENKRLSELLECSQGDMRTADKIITERDRLLSMFDCPDHGQCVPYAMEQAAALRKDAERYRFLKSRTHKEDIELAVCLHDKRTQATVFLDGEYADSQVDIAMSLEVNP